jgi:hypothetical protein
VPSGVLLVHGLDHEPYAQYNSLALDAENVYWRDQPNGVGAIPLAGGPSQIIWYSPNATEGGLAVRGGQVYWVGPDGIYSAPSTARMVQPAPLEDGGGLALAVDDTFLYWTTYAGLACIGGIGRSLLDGGAPITLVSGPEGPSDIALDDAHVYWTNVLTATVNSAPKDGGAPTTLATGQLGVFIHGLAVDATNVYWATPEDGRVMMRPLAGGPPVQLVSGDVGVTGVATDGQYVYWALPTSRGELRRVPIGGGEVTTIGIACPPATCVPGWAGAGLVVVDAQSVYWTTAVDIVKVAK